MDYIRTAKSLRGAGKVWIYGAGSRGLRLLRDILVHRPELTVAGFLDSRKAGTFQSLPVLPIDTYLAGRDQDGGAPDLVVLASAYHVDIAKALHARGVLDFSVYLDPEEDVPRLYAPVEDVIGRFVDHRHPLPIATRDRKIGDGVYYWCPKFTTLYLRPSGMSFCCWIPDLADARHAKSSLDRLMALSREYITHINDGTNALCLSCPDLRMASRPQEISKLTNVDLDISVTCNVKCRYCRVDEENTSITYDYAALFEYAVANGYFEEKFTYSWGGFGEPVLNKQFDAILGKLLSLGANGQIYTNATIFSPLIEEGIRAKLAWIMPSVDAGTKAGYARMKGVDKLETVWRNIARYAKADPHRVHVKYVVTEANCAPEEIARFIERCGEAGVRHITLSRDFYAEALSPTVFDAVLDLARRAKVADMAILMLPAAFPRTVIDDVTRMA